MSGLSERTGWLSLQFNSWSSWNFYQGYSGTQIKQSVCITHKHINKHTQTDEGACINLDLECASLTRGHKWDEAMDRQTHKHKHTHTLGQCECERPQAQLFPTAKSATALICYSKHNMFILLTYSGCYLYLKGTQDWSNWLKLHQAMSFRLQFFKAVYM